MNEIKPSYLFLRILRFVCPRDLFEIIEGDLIEQFELDLNEFGEKKARRRFIWNTLKFYTPEIILRNKVSVELNGYMFLSNIHFALRHFRRQKLNTAVHLIGLTLGISVCIVIALFLNHELSFDSIYPNADKIYRVNAIWKANDGSSPGYYWATPLPLASAIRNQVTGIDKVALVYAQKKTTVQISPQNIFTQEHVVVVEPEFLDMFGIEVLEGDGHRSLSEPYRALLTASTSKKFFGNEDPIGKTFKYKNTFDVTVAGIIRDMPTNTSLPISMLLSYVNNDEFLDNDYWINGNTDWLKSRTCTYVTLDQANIQKVEEQLKSIADLNVNSYPELDKKTRWDFTLQPLRDIHFDTQRFGGGPYVEQISRSWLWFFAAIGVAVLTLACINFVNLSTAQAITRAKEVGIRKFIGARRSQLITQFLIEAWILTSVAGILSVLIAQQVLPYVNQILSEPIAFNLIQSPTSSIVFLSGILITGMLAGLYPAWIIAKFNPMATLRASSTGPANRGSSWLRKGLVITQFAFSAALLMAVLLVAKQVKYMQTKELGFERSHILTVEEPDAKKTPEFSQALGKISGVKDVSFSRTPPLSNHSWVTGISVTKNSEQQGIIMIHGDRNFYSFYGLRLISGRIQDETETTLRPVPKIVINEKLLRALGLGTPAQAIGKRLWWDAVVDSKLTNASCEVIGVVADFHLESLQNVITPAILVQNPESQSLANIKLEEHANVPQTLEDIQRAWQAIFPDDPYHFEFLDQQINNNYKAETNLYSLFKIFSGVALLISCLGLWALVTYSARQRTKEIGIRKVLGATVRSIVILLSRDFMWMLPLALAISYPLVYYFGKDWLQNFAYQVDVGWEVFVFTGASVLILAVLSAGFQTIKTAISNPVDSLRSE